VTSVTYSLELGLLVCREMDCYQFTIHFIIVLVLAFILIRDKENSIIFEILGIIEEAFKHICELLKERQLDIELKDTFHLKLN